MKGYAIAGFKYSENLYEETRYRKMIELLKEYCKLQDKVIADFDAGLFRRVYIWLGKRMRGVQVKAEFTEALEG